MEGKKRWRVRRGKFGFVRGDKSVLGADAIFDATDAEVRGQEYKLDRVDDYTAPSPPPRVAASGTVTRSRKLDRMVKAPPESTVM